MAGQCCWGETYCGGDVHVVASGPPVGKRMGHRRAPWGRQGSSAFLVWSGRIHLFSTRCGVPRGAPCKACSWKASLLIAVLMHFCILHCSMLSQLLGEEGRYRGGVSCVLREAEETVWGKGSPRPSGGRLGGTRLCRRGEQSREGEMGKAAWAVLGILWKLAGLRWRVPQ